VLCTQEGSAKQESDPMTEMSYVLVMILMIYRCHMLTTSTPQSWQRDGQGKESQVQIGAEQEANGTAKEGTDTYEQRRKMQTVELGML